jgi:hypothetical protein
LNVPSGSGALDALEYFGNGPGKIIYSGARYDDGITAAVSFLRDSQEFPTLVLPEFHVEMLALDLQFSRLDDIIHFLNRASLWRFVCKMEEDFARKSSRKFFGKKDFRGSLR